MGRIQKKKPASQKRKKKVQKAGGEGAPAAPVKAAGEEPSSDVPAGSEPKKKKKAPVPKKSASPVKKDKNLLDKTLQFLREVRVELKKVTWPSRKQTLGSTVVVIILVSLIAFFLGVVDVGLSGLIRLVLN